MPEWRRAWALETRLTRFEKLLDSIELFARNDHWHGDLDDPIGRVVATGLVPHVPRPEAGIGFAGQNFMNGSDAESIPVAGPKACAVEMVRDCFDPHGALLAIANRGKLEVQPDNVCFDLVDFLLSLLPPPELDGGDAAKSEGRTGADRKFVARSAAHAAQGPNASIVRLHFVGDAQHLAGESGERNRLTDLYHEPGERLERLSERIKFANSLFVDEMCRLGRDAEELLAWRGIAPSDDWVRATRIGGNSAAPSRILRLAHDHMASQIALDIEIGARSTQARFRNHIEIVSASPARTQAFPNPLSIAVPPIADAPKWIEPDALFAINDRFFAIEADMGTESIEAVIKPKIRGYREIVASRAIDEHFGIDNPTVLFVTTSETRMRNMIAALASIARNGRSAMFGFGCRPDLGAQRDSAQRAFGGVVAEANSAVVEEARESLPALENGVHGLGHFVVARELGGFLAYPGMEAGDERRALFLARGLASLGAEPIEGTLDLEQGVDTLDRLQRHRREDCRRFALGLARSVGLDVGQDEELAARMAPARRLRDGSGNAAGFVELAITAIGVGLQNAGEGREMALDQDEKSSALEEAQATADRQAETAPWTRKDGEYHRAGHKIAYARVSTLDQKLAYNMTCSVSVSKLLDSDESVMIAVRAA